MVNEDINKKNQRKYLKDHGFPIADYEYAETYRDAFNKAKNTGIMENIQ